MNPYRFVVFIHVAAIVGMFGAVVLEWLSLRLVRRSTSYEQGRESMSVWGLVPRLGGPAAILALASGMYLARSIGAWNRSWVAVAIPTMVVVAIAGAVTAPIRKRFATLFDRNAGALPDDAKSQLTVRSWIASLRFRTALLFGLVYEMTVKPSEGVLAIVVFAVVGLLWAVIPSRGGHVSAQDVKIETA